MQRYVRKSIIASSRQRLYELRTQPFRQLHTWLERYRQLWDVRFGKLDELIEGLKEKENADARRRKK